MRVLSPDAGVYAFSPGVPSMDRQIVSYCVIKVKANARSKQLYSYLSYSML